MSIRWIKLLPYGIAALLWVGILWGVFSLGSNHGEANVRAEWQKQKDADAKLVATEKEKLVSQEGTSRTNDRKVADELAEIKAASAADIARIRGESALRLRNSQQREAMYRAASEGGAVERANLASYAAQLDRSLAEGVGLVDELRTTVEVRDGQIKALGAQIISDRQLISGSD